MKLFRVAVATGVVVLLASCSNDRRGLGDAPVGPKDDSPAQIVNFPDTFMNVAFKCLGANGIYTHTREAAPVVIKDDSNCVKGNG